MDDVVRDASEYPALQSAVVVGGQRNQRNVLVQRSLDDHVGRSPVAHVDCDIQPSPVQQRGVRLQIALGVLLQQLQRMRLAGLLCRQRRTDAIGGHDGFGQESIFLIGDHTEQEDSGLQQPRQCADVRQHLFGQDRPIERN